MKLQFRQIEEFVKRPFPEALAILVYGPDEGLVRERAAVMGKTVVSDLSDPFNVVELTGSQLSDTPSRLLDEAQSMSMLGGRRIVRLRDADEKHAAGIKECLAALRAGDNLIIIEAGELNPRSALRLLFENAKNAYAVPCYVEDEGDIRKILQAGLKERGYTIPSDALLYMSANVVGDRGVARSEIEKLVTYMGGQKTIAIDDVIACVGQAAMLSMDALWKAAGSGQASETDRVLKNLLSEGMFPVTILRSLQTHFSRLHITKARIAKGDNLDLALKKLKPDVFWKNKAAFETQLYGLTITQIEQIMAQLTSAEAKCKQSGADPELICSRTVFTLAQLTSKALARRRA